MSINYDSSGLSFPDPIGESSLFKKFWILWSSQRMTIAEFMDRL